ncbi:MAG: GNAT family N-acetyltransferase [Gammaproteobacteria bacterium]
MESHKLVLRNTRAEDFEQIVDLMHRVYPAMGAWSREQFNSQLERFPEGQLCIEDNGKVVAAAASLIVDYDNYGDHHTYSQVTGNAWLTTHNPDGDTLYGADVFVDPDHRNMRLGRRLYDARKELCENLNLRAIVCGGRIPGYREQSGELTPQKYVELVKRRELYDPILTFQLNNDFHVRRVLDDYLPGDKESRAYATLLEWLNVYYERKVKLVGGRKAVVRVAAVQWQMRSVKGIDEVKQQLEFFIDTVSGYKSDFVLLPEYWNAPLMAQFNQKDPPEAIRSLAGFTEELRDELVRLALAYNVNIIGGSLPIYDGELLYNGSYLARRDGTWDVQYKLHATPDERSYWGMGGGDKLKVFDTDVGKVGILICYDVEFPELPRLMAERGMRILFVPYWTDTRNSYLRVQRCAAARAIENECYVVIAGSVGNLPRVENMDIQYGQAAIYTPSDFAFPHDATLAEATPNTEMTLICDLDMDKLRQFRTQGAVRNFHDRRLDLYSLKWLK